MREWNLKAGDPLVLTMAADARLGTTDYCDDQIWELIFGAGEPPALALQTTYGLRALSMRMFPRFGEDDRIVSDPAEFAALPILHSFFPNYLSVRCSPFADIDAELEYWVPQSHAVAGRICLENNGIQPRLVRLSWVAQLNPTEGQRMAPAELHTAPILSGQTGGLAPVVFLTGGSQAVSSPYPALNLEIEMPPGVSRRFTWCHAALGDIEASFALARQTAARPWEAEIARIEMLNTAQVEIYTGDPDWDAAFALSQKLAYSLFVGPTAQLPATSIVLSRQPDQGYSLRGDGSDYNHLWNGQPPLEVQYLAEQLLPGGADLLQGLVRNYIASREGDGSLDWKPGLAGQRSRLLATPVLASLTWRIYQVSQDRAFLEELFQLLLDFLFTWFSPSHDRDGDGVPEWDNPMQAGIEDHPVFSRWREWSQGVDIASAESPGLCALLYRECQAMLHMAAVLEHPGPVPALQSLADHLSTALEAAWVPRSASYQYWDRDSHFSTAGLKLGERTGPGEVDIQRAFNHPARLFVRLQSSDESTRQPELFIYGISATGQHRVEHVAQDQFRWFMGQGFHTGERVYARLERIVLQGIGPSDRVWLTSVRYTRQDQTVLLPLWAGIPDARRAGSLLKRTITSPKRYWRPYGLPACPEVSQNGDAQVCNSTHMPWNALIGEGMLAYGFRQEAAELVSRLMAAIVRNLKQSSAFSHYYHVDTGDGIGERNTLAGLAPLGLFLETLGVRLFSPSRVLLNGYNPFPWPVTVKYRGLTVLRRKDSSVVTFPDGQSFTVTDPTPQIVSLRDDRLD
jgi:hypothetical protein